jgi:hypothetical protein
MSHRVASGLLTASVVVWGIWCGGQVFNELMTVPMWSASPPESLKAYAELPTKGGAPFFPLFNPLFVVLAVSAALASWRTAREARKWLALQAFIAVALFVSLVFYLVPLVGTMFTRSVAGDLPASDIVAGVARWKFGNRIRLVVELLGFLCAVIASRVWSADVAGTVTRANK